jgi:putative hemolysin
MRIEAGRYIVRLAETEEDVAAAQRLRYSVFVEEMGASASDQEHAEKREFDKFDPYFDHLLLIDTNVEGEDQVVGVYRLMTGARAKSGIGFYGSSEYDLTKLIEFPRETLELGRSCVAADHRGGAGMSLMWSGLGQFIAEHSIGVMFGVASFHGDDIKPLSQPLSFLHHKHLAPEDVRVRTLEEFYAPMNLLPEDQVDKAEAMRQIPALIKAYLRLGGFVGDGAFVDHNFNTVDVCLIMDTQKMVDRYKVFFSRQRRGAADRILG